MNHIDRICVFPDTSLVDVLRRHAEAKSWGLPSGIALVVDQEGILLGTITDGDIRRGLLSEGSLDMPAAKLMTEDPITFPDGFSVQSILGRLPRELEKRNRRSQRFLSKIVFLDDDGRPTGVLDYHQVWEQRVATHRPVVVIGLGYVGLTLALALADEGFSVTGVDKDSEKVSTLRRGESYVHERGLPELLKERLNHNFYVSSEIPETGDVFIIAVETPIHRTDGSFAPDLAPLRQVSKEVGKRLASGGLVVLRSTVPVGATRNVVVPILEETSGLSAGSDFHVAFAPERTIEGRALDELRSLPQIIGGLNGDSVEAATALFRDLSSTVVRVDCLESAELVKLINNGFRDLSFAFANELSKVAAGFNIDIHEVIKAANQGYPRDRVPRASPGVGGPCLSKDPQILAAVARQAGLGTTLFEHGRLVNESIPNVVATSILNELPRIGKDPRDCSILACGLAFKGEPETGDLRNSPAVEILRLLEPHVGEIVGHDPVATRASIEAQGIRFSELRGGLKGKDAVLFLNDHVSFKKIDVFAMSRELGAPALVYDGWACFRPEDILHTAPMVYMRPGYVRSSIDAFPIDSEPGEE